MYTQVGGGDVVAETRQMGGYPGTQEPSSQEMPSHGIPKGSHKRDLHRGQNLKET